MSRAVDRRFFIENMAAVGAFFGAGRLLTACSPVARRPVAGLKWSGWNSGEFQVHFIYTGVGESQFLIFPDGTTMLLDCGDHAAHTRGAKAVKILPSMERHAGEWVARYVERVNPHGRDVDYMLLSHFHADHSGCEAYHAGKTSGRSPDYYLSGFAQAAEILHFRRAIDRDWPDYDDPLPLDDAAYMGSLRNMKALYAHLQKRDGLTVEKFRLGARDQLVPLRGSVHDFEVFNFASNGRLCSPKTGEIVNTYHDEVAARRTHFNENAMSTGSLFSYGDFTYYTAGDLSGIYGKKPVRQLEDLLAPMMPKVDVAKINHHACEAMFGPLSKALDARCYVACIWDQVHCTPDTMRALETGPGSHTYFPGIVPTWTIKDGVRQPWMEKVPSACWDGAHVVLTVPPGGKRYSMTLLSAADESMTVKEVLEYQT